MRSSILTLVFLVCGIAANAQFKVGGNLGLPAGDISDYYKVSAGLDLYYMFGKSKDALLKFGATSGFLYYADDVGGGGDFKDASFIPIAGAARITFLSTLTFGPDIGYAIGLDEISINDGTDSGFYWRAVLGIDLGNIIELNAFYHSISAGTTFSSVGGGILFVF